MVQLRLNPAPSSWGCICKREREKKARSKKTERKRKKKRNERVVESGEGRGMPAPGARKYVGPRCMAGRRRGTVGKERVLRTRGAIYHGATKQPTPDESCICIDGPFPAKHTIEQTHTHTHIRVTDRHLPSRPLTTLSTEAREREVRHPFP